MRIGIIRGDLPGPIFLADLETVSQRNFPTEPPGQTIYISRPTTAQLDAVFANPVTGAGAVIQGTDIASSFPITISGSNNTLRVRTSSGASFTAVTIASGALATMGALITALNTALRGTGITAFTGVGTGSRVSLEGPRGTSSYVANDTTANGSNANATLGLGTGGNTRTFPASSACITALSAAGGTLDVSTTTINGVGATTSANAMSLIPSSRGTHTALAQEIAPYFAETPVVIDSYLTGSIAQYRSASYNPDARRGLTAGAAISVLQDDGSTAYSAGLPVITSAVISTGIVTITGTVLGNAEQYY